MEIIAINTDTQGLKSKKIIKSLGSKISHSDRKSYYKIRRFLKNANLVFIITEIYDETIIKVLPIITKITNRIGALTIGIVTKSLKKESTKKIKLVKNRLNILKNKFDLTFIFSNQKVISQNRKKSYKIDNLLYRIINGIMEILIAKNDLIADFVDLQLIMDNNNIAFMGIGHKSGKNSAYEALVDAIKTSSLDNINIMNVKGLLINVTTKQNYPLADIDEAIELLLENFLNSENIIIIQGETYDNSFLDDEIDILIIRNA